ncbi:flagellar basal body P-ring formation chaperone FlgA [Erythrobacter aureus]|uniref:Flagella basal body P-ring formation protein FlgA n=1 Tax=Erythrobacter aureus TaxID=2182384 RepID=A0A345YJP1_9SPHN|nr:flagellar basal body P-ring formation chaperone FlgA [Erythrobacter aureus]AXK44143.1 flagella basal body P-ring formation protein FlgA [Erythrobacter aureus]
MIAGRLTGFAIGAAALLCAAPAAAQMVSADVLARTVQRGEIVSASDFESKELSAGSARSALSADEADGLEAVRTLRAGMPVRASYLSEPNLVRRGDPVTITIRSGALTITASGKALGDGAENETVRVFSDVTNHTFDAIVEGSGAVRVIAR